MYIYICISVYHSERCRVLDLKLATFGCQDVQRYLHWGSNVWHSVNNSKRQFKDNSPDSSAWCVTLVPEIRPEHSASRKLQYIERLKSCRNNITTYHSHDNLSELGQNHHTNSEHDSSSNILVSRLTVAWQGLGYQMVTKLHIWRESLVMLVISSCIQGQVGKWDVGTCWNRWGSCTPESLESICEKIKKLREAKKFRPRTPRLFRTAFRGSADRLQAPTVHCAAMASRLNVIQQHLLASDSCPNSWEFMARQLVGKAQRCSSRF